jgi:hypothetical protein
MARGLADAGWRKWRRMDRQCQYRWPGTKCMTWQFPRDFMVSAPIDRSMEKAFEVPREALVMTEAHPPGPKFGAAHSYGRRAALACNRRSANEQLLPSKRSHSE